MKRVFITGSTSGIGLATAKLFARNGFFVILNGRREELGREIEKEIQKLSKCEFIKADVSKPSEVKSLFAKIRKDFRSLDVLVSNAGGSTGTDDFYKATTGDLDLGFKNTFYSAFYCSQEVIKVMKKGSIVNVGSVCGIGTSPVGEGETIPIYSAAKAALHNFSQNLAKLLAPNIRVNTVVPGYTIAPSWGKLSEEEEKRLSAQTWIKRFNTPEEVAEVIWLLATNEAMTGSQVIIDGGITLK